MSQPPDERPGEGPAGGSGPGWGAEQGGEDATRELGGWAQPDPSRPPAPGPYGPPPGAAPPPSGQQDPPGQAPGAWPPYAGTYPPAGQHGSSGWAGYAAPTTSPKATWALVVGIVSLVMGCCGGPLGLVGIASVVLGTQARREIAQSAGRLTGDGPALAGIVTGAVGAAVGLLTSLLGFVRFTAGFGA